MPDRKTLMRGMLWSLAFAGVTGVLAVLLNAGDVIWRVVGTGLVTAAACGLMLPITGMVDRAASRSAGLLGMAGIIIEYVLAMLLIWEPLKRLVGVWVEQELLLTTVFFGMAAPTGMGLLRAWTLPRGRVAARVGLAALAAVFSIFMIATWTTSRTHSNTWWETGAALFLCSILAVVTLSAWGAGLARGWRWAGIAGAGLALLLWLGDIWIGAGSDVGFVTFCLAMSLAAVIAHASACAICTLSPGQRWVRVTAVAATIAAAALVDALAIEHELSLRLVNEDIFERLAGAAGIVAGCTTLSLLVLARLNRRTDYDPATGEAVLITLICPRCRRKQHIAPGSSACAHCRLRITIEIEEPRCPTCDYLLYRLTSDRCPECGTPIHGVVAPVPPRR